MWATLSTQAAPAALAWKGRVERGVRPAAASTKPTKTKGGRTRWLTRCDAEAAGNAGTSLDESPAIDVEVVPEAKKKEPPKPKPRASRAKKPVKRKTDNNQLQPTSMSLDSPEGPVRRMPGSLDEGEPRVYRERLKRTGTDGIDETLISLDERFDADGRIVENEVLMMMKPLPRVLLIHTGGTLGMDPQASYNMEEDATNLVEGTGGVYKKGLVPSQVLADLRHFVPELQSFANLDVLVAFNRDSCRVGPNDWIKLAKILHQNRTNYHAFMVVHGTDTMAYTAAALSVMLSGFGKPIVVTGSQLPLLMPRSDARQNLIDSITVATAGTVPPYVQPVEVVVCFGGKLLRGNRAQKTNSAAYQAFSSPSYPELACLGVEVDWTYNALLPRPIAYQPRFKLDSRVIRVPIVPGCDPRMAYGDLYGRGVRGIVLEAFGLGNMPDTTAAGWLPWLRAQRKKGLLVYLASQCTNGELHPELYRSGLLALEMGVEAGPKMTPECAVVKMMLVLAYRDLSLTSPLAGEL